MWPNRHHCNDWRFIPDPLILPWFAMTDSRIADIKTAGTTILVQAAIFVLPAHWDGVDWASPNGGPLPAAPCQWMPMPAAINEPIV